LDTALEVQSQVEVQVIQPVPETLNRTVVHRSPCPANFQATGFVPVLLIAQSVENWMNKPCGRWWWLPRGLLVVVDEGNRFIQRLVNPTQVFPKQSVKDGILIRGMTFTKPPEPVGTLCRIQGFPRFRIVFFCCFWMIAKQPLLLPTIPSDFFGGVTNPGGKAAIHPRTTVQLISAKVCSGWERVEKF